MGVIGFFGNLGYEFALPHVGGALRYCRENRDVRLHDFLFTEPQELEDGPPWKDKVDGIILATGFTGGAEEAQHWIKQGGVPGVSVVSNFVSDCFPSVFTDPWSIAGLAFAEFTRLDTTRLLTIGFEDFYGTQQRGEALAKLAEAAKIPIQHETFAQAEGNEDSRILDEIVEMIGKALKGMKRSGGPLGVLAINDQVARFVVQGAHALGLSIPKQVAIIGVDDSPVAFRERPTITSIRYPGEEIGHWAVEILVRRLKGKSLPDSPLLLAATGIEVRETTGGSSEWPDELGLALELIRRDAFTGKTVGEITASLPLSLRTLQRRFHERIGVTPQDELNRLRLARAKELLRGSDFAVSRIAELVGFTEPSAFTRFFQRHSGDTPQAYRKKGKDKHYTTEDSVR